MNKDSATNKLKTYSAVRFQQQFLRIKIEGLKDRLRRLPEYSDIAAKEAEIARLEGVWRDNRRFMADVETVLNYLPERERLTLWYFYVERTHDYIEILNEKLNVERSQIYRIKDNRLELFMLLSVEEFY